LPVAASSPWPFPALQIAHGVSVTVAVAVVVAVAGSLASPSSLPSLIRFMLWPLSVWYALGTAMLFFEHRRYKSFYQNQRVMVFEK
jgi:hypothetical protein